MPLIEFRFYEELNAFLRMDRRRRSFCYRCSRDATVKQAIEALGVPHTEVELILVDGESVDFGHLLKHAERVSVYPKFESIDVSSLLRVRDRVLRRSRFVVDAHLGGLAKYLRLAGFDTLFPRQCSDSELAKLASREGRVLLSRDRDLLKRRIVTHGCYVRAQKPRNQLREVLSRLDLANAMAPFSRCLRCNAKIEELASNSAASPLARALSENHTRFWQCPQCSRVYWRGSHFRHMQRLLNEIIPLNGRAQPAGDHRRRYS